MDLLRFIELLRLGQLFFDERDTVDEVGDRCRAVGRVAGRSISHQGGEVLAGAVEDRRDLQRPVPLQALVKRRERGCGRLAREHEVGDRAEREDVQELWIGVGDS